MGVGDRRASASTPSCPRARDHPQSGGQGSDSHTPRPARSPRAAARSTSSSARAASCRCPTRPRRPAAGRVRVGHTRSTSSVGRGQRRGPAEDRGGGRRTPAVTAAAGRRGAGTGCGSAIGSGRQGRVLLQDRLLERLQLRAGVDAELLGQVLAGAAQGRERVALPGARGRARGPAAPTAARAAGARPPAARGRPPPPRGRRGRSAAPTAPRRRRPELGQPHRLGPQRGRRRARRRPHPARARGPRSAARPRPPGRRARAAADVAR